METQIFEGLEGVLVTRTKLSEVDGEAGRLTVGGFDIEALTGQVSFEAACHLLEHLQLPSPAQEEAVRASLANARRAAFAELPRILPLLSHRDPMAGLRAAVAALDAESGFSGGASLIGAVGVFVAALARKRAGAAPLAPDASLPHAADVARMALGTLPEAARVTALESYLVTVMDHGLNASTFAARVVASTGSDDVSAICAAIGALKGPLHGGAPGPVLDMLDAIGTEAQAETWLARELEQGRRIMGMGHRVYRVRDPRAAALERALGQLEESGIATPRLSLARAVERAAAQLLANKYPSRALAANVEFYTAVLLDAVGIARESFSSMFAVGRVVGWCAHLSEQRARGRLIRPSSLYDGPREASVAAAPA